MPEDEATVALDGEEGADPLKEFRPSATVLAVHASAGQPHEPCRAEKNNVPTMEPFRPRPQDLSLAAVLIGILELPQAHNKWLCANS